MNPLAQILENKNWVDIFTDSFCVEIERSGMNEIRINEMFNLISNLFEKKITLAHEAGRQSVIEAVEKFAELKAIETYTPVFRERCVPLTDLLSFLSEAMDKLIKLSEPKDCQPPAWTVLNMLPKDTTENLYKQCESLFPCWKSDYIDLSTVKNERGGNYTIAFCPNIEADEEWKNISANDLPKDRKFIQLNERLKLEIQYFKATGQHLDIQNITVCSGSRGSGGGVPRCRWCDDGFRVAWCCAGDSGGNLRGRAAV